MFVRSRLHVALLSTVALSVIPCIANAADLPVKAHYEAPAAFSWTGFYLGGSVGAVQHSTTTEFGAVQYWDTSYTSPALTHSGIGGIVGGQIGYNYQIRNFVIGAEADISGLFGGKKSISSAWNDCGIASCMATPSTDPKGFASVRARFGFDVMNGTLVYATAGIGWVNLNNNFNVTGTNGKNGNFSANQWVPAIVVGGGVEQAINANWSVRGEVLWAKTETISALPTDLHYFDSTTPAVNYTNELVIGRLGLNYRF